MRIAVALILLLITSCSRPMVQSDVLGTYVANHGKGFDSIELHANGSYVYVFRSGSREVRNTGRWRFYHQDGSPRITFHDFVFGLQGYGGRVPGYWDVE